MDAVMTVPPPTSIRTWAVVVPRVTSTTGPLIMLRALSFIIDLQGFDGCGDGSRSSNGRREPEALKHASRVAAQQPLDEGLGDRRVPGCLHDRGGVNHRPIRVFAGPERLPYALGAGGEVGGVDEAGLDLAPGHVVEGLPNVLGEHQLRLDALPQPRRPQALLRVLPDGNGLRIADDDAPHARVEEVPGMHEIDRRIRRLDHDEG